MIKDNVYKIYYNIMSVSIQIEIDQFGMTSIFLLMFTYMCLNTKNVNIKKNIITKIENKCDSDDDECDSDDDECDSDDDECDDNENNTENDENNKITKVERLWATLGVEPISQFMKIDEQDYINAAQEYPVNKYYIDPVLESHGNNTTGGTNELKYIFTKCIKNQEFENFKSNLQLKFEEILISDTTKSERYWVYKNFGSKLTCSSRIIDGQTYLSLKNE